MEIKTKCPSCGSEVYEDKGTYKGKCVCLCCGYEHKVEDRIEVFISPIKIQDIVDYLGSHTAPELDPNIVEQIINLEPFKFEDGEMYYRMKQEEVKNILDSEYDIGDKHYELRNLFFGEIQDYFDQDDKIHMDCVSDALDNLLGNILEYLNNK